MGKKIFSFFIVFLFSLFIVRSVRAESIGSCQGRLQIKPESPDDVQVLGTASAVIPVTSPISPIPPTKAISIPTGDVEFIYEGFEFYTKTLKEIKNAKRSIYVVMFSMRAETGYTRHPVNILVSELIAAKKRGVEVHVILDDTLTKGGVSISQAAYTMLWESGVDVRFDSPAKITHTKLVIIDDYVTITGSHNWSVSAFRYNNESSLLVRSRGVAQRFKEHFQSIK